jgi:hypothetical protein
MAQGYTIYKDYGKEILRIRITEDFHLAYDLPDTNTGYHFLTRDDATGQVGKVSINVLSNFYISDGTLTDDRNVEIGDKSLSFEYDGTSLVGFDRHGFGVSTTNTADDAIIPRFVITEGDRAEVQFWNSRLWFNDDVVDDYYSNDGFDLLVRNQATGYMEKISASSIVPAFPNEEVVYGTGGGMASSSTFTYDGTFVLIPQLLISTVSSVAGINNILVYDGNEVKQTTFSDLLSANNGVTGSGTLNYLARWTPDGVTLGIGATRDDGTNVGFGIAPDASYRVNISGTLRVTGASYHNSTVVLNHTDPVLAFINGSGTNPFSGNNAIINLYDNYLRLVDAGTSQKGINIDLPNGRVMIGNGIFSQAPVGMLHVTGTYTASSAIARGTYNNVALVAASTNDVLVGLDINNTFTTGAFGGVTRYAIRTLTGNILFGSTTITNNDNFFLFSTGSSPLFTVQTASQTGKLINLNGQPNQNFGFGIEGGGSNYGLAVYSASTVIASFESNGGLIIGSTYATTVNGIANGLIVQTRGLVGTSTDSGIYTWDVAGTARFSGITYIHGGGGTSLRLKGAGAGATNTVGVGFYDSNDVRTGFVGDYTSGDTAIRLYSDGTIVGLSTSSGDALTITGVNSVFTGSITATANGHRFGFLQLLTSGNAASTGTGITITGSDSTFDLQGSGTGGIRDIFKFRIYNSEGTYKTLTNSAGTTHSVIRVFGGFGGTPNVNNLNGATIYLTPTYDFTGNIRTGTTIWGIKYEPTIALLTGVSSHVAIETVTGDIIFNSTSGNTLIGGATINPSYKFDVNGAARIQGTLSVAGIDYQSGSANMRLIGGGTSSLRIRIFTTDGWGGMHWTDQAETTTLWSVGINTVGGSVPVGIGVTITSNRAVVNSASILELYSLDKGFLPPRMSIAQWLAIPDTQGLMGYATDDNSIMWHDGTGALGLRYNRSTSKWQGYTEGIGWVDLN